MKLPQPPCFTRRPGIVPTIAWPNSVGSRQPQVFGVATCRPPGGTGSLPRLAALYRSGFDGDCLAPEPLDLFEHPLGGEFLAAHAADLPMRPDARIAPLSQVV